MTLRVQSLISGLTAGHYAVRLSVLDAAGAEILVKQSDSVEVPVAAEVPTITQLSATLATQTQVKAPAAVV